MHRLSPWAEPALYAGVVAAAVQAAIAQRGTTWPRRTRMLAATGVAIAGAAVVRQLVTPYFDAQDESPENAGLPAAYQPPPVNSP